LRTPRHDLGAAVIPRGVFDDGGNEQRRAHHLTHQCHEPALLKVLWIPPKNEQSFYFLAVVSMHRTSIRLISLCTAVLSSRIAAGVAEFGAAILRESMHRINVRPEGGK